MSWFDEAANEAEAIRSRTESIDEESEKIYNVLWGEIMKEVLKLGYEQHLHIAPGCGSTFERTLVQQALPSTGEANPNTLRTMRIKLSADKIFITAHAPRLGKYGESKIAFQLDALDDGVVQLMHNAAPVEIHTAAVMLLRHFLFPELPLKTQQHVI